MVFYGVTGFDLRARRRVPKNWGSPGAGDTRDSLFGLLVETVEREEMVWIG